MTSCGCGTVPRGWFFPTSAPLQSHTGALEAFGQPSNRYVRDVGARSEGLSCCLAPETSPQGTPAWTWGMTVALPAYGIALNLLKAGRCRSREGCGCWAAGPAITDTTALPSKHTWKHPLTAGNLQPLHRGPEMGLQRGSERGLSVVTEVGLAHSPPWCRCPGSEHTEAPPC